MVKGIIYLQLVFFLCFACKYSIGDAPNFISGCGLTFLSSTQINNQLYEVVVSSKQVLGNQTVRILLPTDYFTSGSSRRYPSLYLLHGATDNATTWTRPGKGEAQNITGNASLITVMPNGDRFGFYTNWVLPGQSAPQNWRTFHMEELVPWIDLNLRTIAKKEGRAIAGLSMGGFGAMHYAEAYSDNFIYGASFSGVLNLLDPRVQTLVLNLPGKDNPLIGPFGYPTSPITSTGWFAADTIAHAAELRNISIALLAGNASTFEATLGDGSFRLHDVLVALNVPVYFHPYGNGQSIGHGCNGDHNWGCFNAALNEVFPRIMAALQQQY